MKKDREQAKAERYVDTRYVEFDDKFIQLDVPAGGTHKRGDMHHWVLVGRLQDGARFVYSIVQKTKRQALEHLLLLNGKPNVTFVDFEKQPLPLAVRIKRLESTRVTDPMSPFVGERVISKRDALKAIAAVH
jgi:hypothetical protein